MDALLTVFKGHVVSAACDVLGIEKPSAELPDRSPHKQTVAEQKKFLEGVASKAISLLPLDEIIVGEEIKDSGDGVFNNSIVLCHFACLVLELTDAWGEGDRERVLRCWRVLLLQFSASRRTKYALEALQLQFQLATLPPHLVHHLMWGRFVNTRSGVGNNIPCDLFNEHVNKLFKEVIGNMGSNFTEQSSSTVAKALSSLAVVAENFSKETGISPDSTATQHDLM